MIAAVFDQVFHAYGAINALEHITATISAGDFHVVIGPNGSGKTTLLKALAGIEPVKSGLIRIFEKPIDRYSRRELARVIAYVPQTLPMRFPLTAEEVVLSGRAPHLGLLGLGGRRDTEIADEAMRLVEVSHLTKRRLDRLSGGERQRVFIAKALCQEPRMLLLDEPTASLDLSYQVGVLDLMRRLISENGLTVVMVSHDINAAAMYGESLTILKDGRLVVAGRPSDVLTPQILEDVYGCRLWVDESPLGAFPRITPIPENVTVQGANGLGFRHTRASTPQAGFRGGNIQQ